MWVENVVAAALLEFYTTVPRAIFHVPTLTDLEPLVSAHRILSLSPRFIHLFAFYFLRVLSFFRV
jgi:hypothetical protein